MQSAIIINVSVGLGYSDQQIEYETQAGKEYVGIAECIQRLARISFQRPFELNNILLPRLLTWCYKPSDLRFKRNILRLRQVIQSLIDDRRKGNSKTYDKEADLLSILLSTEFYEGRDDLMIDEILTFFVAGMKTI